MRAYEVAMARRSSRPWLLIAFGLLLSVLAAVVTVAVVVRNAGEERFAAACRAVRIGGSFTEAERDFHRATGRVSSGSMSIAGRPPSQHVFFRRSGLSRHQQCTLDVAPTGDVIGASLRSSNDFESCADPFTYPRRHWLCRAAASIAP